MFHRHLRKNCLLVLHLSTDFIYLLDFVCIWLSIYQIALIVELFQVVIVFIGLANYCSKQFVE